MQFNFTIPDSSLAGIEAARATHNMDIPQTVSEGEGADAVEVPNPAIKASATEYLSFVLSRAIESWAAQHGATPTPAPAPGPVVISGVPQSVDMVKAEVYFIRIGVLSAISAAINASGAEAKAIWARSKTIQRQNPLMLQIARQVLGWTDAQIDYHFIEADKVAL